MCALRALSLSLISICSPPFHSSAGPAPWRPSPADLATLDDALAREVRTRDIPGLAVTVVSREGALFTGCYGLADATTGRPVTPQTLFRVGSITKSFLAATVMRLVERGELDLDAPLSLLAPELPLANPWRHEVPITLAHLLEHTSGLEENHFDEVMDREGREDRPMAEVLLRHPEYLRARWRPGSRFAYSNRSYVIAGHLLERRRGVPFEDVVHAELFAPMGLRRAALRRTEEVAGRLAVGYLRDARRPVAYLPAWHRPAASLMIDIEELGAFVRMLLGRGELDGRRVLSPESLARMESSHTSPAGRAGLEVFAGPGISARARRPVVALGHYGGGYAFASIFQYFPDQGLGYALLMNVSHRSEVFDRVQELLFEVVTREMPRRVEPEAARPEDELGRLTGTYMEANPWYSVLRAVEFPFAWIQLTLEDGELMVHRPGHRPRRLVPVDRGHFRLEDEPVATCFFVEEEGATVLTGSDLHLVRVPLAWPVLVRNALAASLALIVLSLPLGVLHALRGGRRSPLEGAVAGLGLALLTGLWLGYHLEYHDLGGVGPRTVTLWALGWLYGLAVPLTVVASLWRRPGRVGESPGSLVVVPLAGHLVWFTYLGWWGMLGVRLWAD